MRPAPAVRRPVSRLVLGASLLLLSACGGGGGEEAAAPSGGAAPAPAGTAGAAGAGAAAGTPVASGPALKLMATLLGSRFRPGVLPAGYLDAGARAEAPSARAREAGAVGKVTFDVQIAHTAHADKVSYTVYPSAEHARQGFAVLGQRPADRKVSHVEPVQPTGIDAPVWGETSFEVYGDKQFVRTSTAALTGDVIVLAQTAVVGEPQPSAREAAVVLLRSGVLHLQDILNDVPQAAGSPTGSPAASPAAASASPAAPASPTPEKR